MECCKKFFRRKAVTTAIRWYALEELYQLTTGTDHGALSADNRRFARLAGNAGQQPQAPMVQDVPERGRALANAGTLPTRSDSETGNDDQHGGSNEHTPQADNRTAGDTGSTLSNDGHETATDRERQTPLQRAHVSPGRDGAEAAPSVEKQTQPREYSRRRCGYCGKWFTPKREHGRFCKTACRNREYRERSRSAE